MLDVPSDQPTGVGQRQDYVVGDRPHGIVAGDFNGDYLLDLAVPNYGDDDVTVLYGQVGGGLGGRQDYGVGTEPFRVVTGDFNGDSLVDLAVTAGGGDSVSVLYGRPMYILTVNVINNLPGTDIDVDRYMPNYVYPAGTEVTIHAIPAEGKSFNYFRLWDPNHPDDGNYVVEDSNNPITITMDADRKVTAVFRLCGSGIGPMLPMIVLVLLGVLTIRRRR